MLHRSRFNIRENETSEPEDDLPDLEAERAFANAVIVEGMKRNPKRAREVIAAVTRSLAERYSVEEVSAAVDQLLGELEAHGQRRQ
jgi:K+/H+ antiporter YhaU regulatory subunit KhtT